MSLSSLSFTGLVWCIVAYESFSKKVLLALVGSVAPGNINRAQKSIKVFESKTIAYFTPVRMLHPHYSSATVRRGEGRSSVCRPTIRWRKPIASYVRVSEFHEGDPAHVRILPVGSLRQKQTALPPPAPLGCESASRSVRGFARCSHDWGSLSASKPRQFCLIYCDLYRE